MAASGYQSPSRPGGEIVEDGLLSVAEPAAIDRTGPHVTAATTRAVSSLFLRHRRPHGGEWIALRMRSTGQDKQGKELVSWVNENQDDIRADHHLVPAELLGGDTRNLDWTGIGFQDPIEVRHHFALATCNGCHGGETATLFAHMDRRRRSAPPVLSQYLTAETIVHPGGQTSPFHDLPPRPHFLRAPFPHQIPS